MVVVLSKKSPSAAEKDLNSIRKDRDLSFFDLVSVDQVSIEDLALLYEVARRFRDYKTYKFSFNKGSSQERFFRAIDTHVFKLRPGGQTALDGHRWRRRQSLGLKRRKLSGYHRDDRC